MKIPELIVLDTETTGLDPENDRICEIALLKIKDAKIVEVFTTLINPEVKIPDISTSGISNKDVEKAPLFKDIIHHVNNLIKNQIILCHNAKFDISFLKKEFKRCNFEFPEIKVIDTYLIAKIFFNFKSNSLKYLSHHFGVERIVEHRAEDDAKATFELFKIMCEKIEKNYTDDFFQKVIFDIWKIEDKIITIIEKFSELIKEKKKVSIIYVSNNKGINDLKEISKREIKPLEIIEESGVKFLKAFCYLKNEERKFRFDRIIKIIENIPE